MGNLKHKLGLKFAVFAAILVVLFWLIPSGMAFGEGEENEGQTQESTIIESGLEEPQTEDPPGPAVDNAPVITLIGDAVINIAVGDTYVDAGATASDVEDGDLTASIVVSGFVDTLTAGEYTLTYNVSDSAGNAAASVSRTVNVIKDADTNPPVITLNGDALIYLRVGDVYVDPGAFATDDRDEKVEVIARGYINLNLAGSYIITYDATDSSGNNAITVTRTVIVTPTPSIATDKPDYMPDNYVLVTGSGWLPNEIVRLDFIETIPDTNLQQTVTIYTTADNEGNIYDYQYLIEFRHLGTLFTLIATGQTSGLTAFTTFTDATQSTPTFNPEGPAIPMGTEVTITSPNAEHIYYTTDGSTPTTSSTEYTGPVTINPPMTLKAIATRTGYRNSSVKTTDYVLAVKISIHKFGDKIILNGVQDTGEPNLEGVQFELFRNYYGVWWSEVVLSTDKDGNLTFSGLSAGSKYRVKEKAAAPGYSMITTPVYEGEINSDESIDVPNVAPADINIHKFGDTNQNDIQDGTEPNLSGVQFELSIEKTFLGVPYWESQGTKSTDASGNLKFANLNIGAKYKIMEKAAATGYSLIASPIFEGVLTATQTINVPNVTPPSISIHKFGDDITINGVQDPGEPNLEGVEFELFIQQTILGITYWVSEGKLSTDPSGNLTFSNLVVGNKYRIMEVAAAPGYSQITAPVYEKVITKDETIEVANIDGRITLYKVDSNNPANPIGGAVFALYSSDDEASLIAGSEVVSDPVTGQVLFEHINFGTYYVHEKSAPTGFVPDDGWYQVTIDANNPHYNFTAPIANTIGGTITVTKNVVAPDAKTDVSDDTEFSITLQKKDGSGNWTDVKTATIKEGSPVVFAVPLNVSYRVIEASNSKYSEINKPGEVTLTSQGQNADLTITNRQHYAVITVAKLIHEGDFLDFKFITGDDHIFWLKLDGGNKTFIEWHPITSGIPTVFLVWPGTYSIYEKPDANYNNGGQPGVLYGFDILNIDWQNLTWQEILNILASFGKKDITVEGGDVKFIGVFNKYTPTLGTVTVTKDVFGPDCHSQVADPTQFPVKLQRLNLDLPSVLDILDLGGLFNGLDLTNIANILSTVDLSKLLNVSLDWVDVGDPKTVAEGQNAVWEGVEVDHIYRVVETHVPGYEQICGMLPFYFAPDKENLTAPVNKQVNIVNIQKLVFVKVTKNVLDVDGSDICDNEAFWVKLEGGPTPTFPQLVTEKCSAYFAVLPGTYRLVECSETCYTRVDQNQTLVLQPDDGPLCNPVKVEVTNQRKPGTITIKKSGLMPGDSAIFTLCDKDGNPIEGIDPITLKNGESGSWENLKWGCYTISESYPCDNLYNYTSKPIFKPCGSIFIGCSGCVHNFNACVTVKNGGAQLKTAKIKIHKDVVGTALATDEFKFSVFDGTNTQEVAIGGLGGDSADITVEAGKTYTITESVIPSCFNVTDWSTDIPEGTLDENSPSVSFTVTGCNYTQIDGKKVSFENTRKTCTVELEKTLKGLSAPEGVFNFAFTGSPATFALGGIDPYVTFLNVECGIEYTLTESALSPGYEISSITASENFAKAETDLAARSITFIVECPYAGGNSTATMSEAFAQEISAFKITYENARKPGMLRLQKVSAADLSIPVAGAVYEVRDSASNLVANITTAADGWAYLSLPWGTYTVKEVSAPSGFDLDPTTYTITIGGASTDVWLYVKNNPSSPGGGITETTVAGLVEVLAFTGVDPVIPIAGLGAIAGGLGLFITSLIKRRRK